MFLQADRFNARYKVYEQFRTFSGYSDLHALAAGFCIEFYLPVLGRSRQTGCSYHVVLFFLFGSGPWSFSNLVIN